MESETVATAAREQLRSRDLARSTTPTRARRTGALALDVLALGGFVLAGLVLAFAWLLPATAWGRDDATQAEAMLGWSLLAASLPAWASWHLLGVLEGASFGQRRLGLHVAAVEGFWLHRPLVARLVRAAVHPLAAVAYAWLALPGWLLAGSWGAIPFLVPALVVLQVGALSAGMALAAPGTPLLHDRLAGTRLLRP